MEQFNKWLKWGLYIGVFAVPFIPFIISTTYFFPFITGKNFTFRILIDVLFALYLLLAFRDPAYRPRFSWVSISVLALASGLLAQIFQHEVDHLNGILFVDKAIHTEDWEEFRKNHAQKKD
jgi:hypothetical protein